MYVFRVRQTIGNWLGASVCFQLSMHTQRKQYCFRLVNVIIRTTLVVINTKLLLQILNIDNLYFFQNG